MRKESVQVGTMIVDKCANPSCDTKLSAFKGGQLFVFELPGGSDRPLRLGHFWLCAHCASGMIISVDGTGRARIEPLHPGATTS